MRVSEFQHARTVIEWRGLPADTGKTMIGLKQFKVTSENLAGSVVHNLRTPKKPQLGFLRDTRIGREDIFDSNYTARVSTRTVPVRNSKATLATTLMLNMTLLHAGFARLHALSDAGDCPECLCCPSIAGPLSTGNSRTSYKLLNGRRTALRLRPSRTQCRRIHHPISPLFLGKVKRIIRILQNILDLTSIMRK